MWTDSVNSHTILKLIYDSLFSTDMDIGVIGSHVAKQTAELTMQGEFTKARVKSLSAQKMLHEQRLI